MEKKVKKVFNACIVLIVVMLMGIQILEGMRWMFWNIKAMPAFGDSIEYLNLSQTLVLDEYRPILYPLILRYLQSAASFIGLPFQPCLYAIQSLVSFGALFYCVCVLDRAVLKLYPFGNECYQVGKSPSF